MKPQTLDALLEHYSIDKHKKKYTSYVNDSCIQLTTLPTITPMITNVT